MTTAVREDVYLAWDAFLGERERRHVEAYRRNQWPNIRREYTNLAKRPVALPDGLEPHWVAPGKAVYWQLQVTLRQPEGTPEQWLPTAPLPASTASVIARYLGKGLRLRPPVEGVAVETLQAAVPAEALQEPAIEERPTFKCTDHGMDNYVYTTWRAYVRHCIAHREPPDMGQAPKHILERLMAHPYYCWLHNAGFNSRRVAERHMRGELRKPGRAVHPTLDQMQTNATLPT